MDNSLDRIHLPSIADFSERYQNPDFPVLLEGLVSSWPALNKWTPNYLADQFGDREVPIATMRDGNYGGGEQNDRLLRDYLRLIGAVDGASDGDRSAEGILDTDTTRQSELTHYLAQVSLAKYFPELLDDIVQAPFFQNETAGNTYLYVGGSLFSQLHYHPFGSATLSVISGKKRVRLFAPDQGTHLYSNSWRSNTPHLSLTHHKDPDPIEYPKFAQAKYIDVTVLPGEMLFIPIYWWHSIENIGVSISVTSFWSRSWTSRFLPPSGPRASYLYEPARRYVSLTKGGIVKAARALHLVK